MALQKTQKTIRMVEIGGGDPEDWLSENLDMRLETY